VVPVVDKGGRSRLFSICLGVDNSIDVIEFDVFDCGSSSIVGEAGPYNECRWRRTGRSVDGTKCSLVTGNGCIDLRREPTLLEGFI
jgi:hypothetical protein